ncbi:MULTISPECIES: hypothetical protein [unclassified Rhizobium]|uniref:hypothetical protein n=1 Tax=unclassified Rhizobium TaxID=2613769 RepID=UPI0006F34B5B|nr:MULTISPECIES: hypothetical protein [unclassified Rhizobium]KQV39902.1 hypothetical protein ASC86_21890 [Rhizobium sp. Root1212]KRD31612.1 hypothetical protein ASE37_22935 [Rhizobium sp. Root268]
MPSDPTLLSASAVALSVSATFTALMKHLHRIGAVSSHAEREIYAEALKIIEQSQGDDDSKLFEHARALIIKQLGPLDVKDEVAD